MYVIGVCRFVLPTMAYDVSQGSKWYHSISVKKITNILSIYDEFAMGLSEEQFMDILKHVAKDPHGFLFTYFDRPWDEVMV